MKTKKILKTTLYLFPIFIGVIATISIYQTRKALGDLDKWEKLFGMIWIKVLAFYLLLV